jgi:hypothetical protein
MTVPLALQHFNAAQAFPGDTSSTATPTLISSERRHPAIGIALLVAPE